VTGKGAVDGSTSCIAPVKKEILNKNSVYEYKYYTLIRRLEEMQGEIYQIRKGNN
jgi:hypothetical protein